MCGADRGSEEVLERKGTLFLPSLLLEITSMVFSGYGVSDCVMEQPYSSHPSLTLHLSRSLCGE